MSRRTDYYLKRIKKEGALAVVKDDNERAVRQAALDPLVRAYTAVISDYETLRENRRGLCEECGWAGMVWIVVLKGEVQGAFAAKKDAELEKVQCLKQDPEADVSITNIYIDPVEEGNKQE